MSQQNTERVSMGKSGDAGCRNCIHRVRDRQHPGWGWCGLPANRVPASKGWPAGFTPSQAPDGWCNQHTKAEGASHAG